MDKRDIEHIIKQANGESQWISQGFSTESKALETYNTLKDFAEDANGVISHIELIDNPENGMKHPYYVRGIINFKENN